MTFEEMEKLRRTANKKIIKFHIITGIFAVVFSVTYMTLKGYVIKDLSEDMLLIAIIVLIISSILIIFFEYSANHVKRSFLALVKKNTVYLVIDKFFQDITYEPEKHIDKEEINRIGIISYFSIISGEDSLSASYEGKRFNVSEVKLEAKSGKNTYTVFKGRWFIFDSKINIPGIIRIVGKGKAAKKSDVSKIETESTDFNNLFNCYTSNPLFFFYVMNAKMIENLISFKEKNSDFSLAMIDDKIHIAINDKKDFLKVKINEEITDSVFDTYKSDFEEIINLINELDLNSYRFNQEEM